MICPSPVDCCILSIKTSCQGSLHSDAIHPTERKRSVARAQRSGAWSILTTSMDSSIARWSYSIWTTPGPSYQKHWACLADFFQNFWETFCLVACNGNFGCLQTYTVTSIASERPWNTSWNGKLHESPASPHRIGLLQMLMERNGDGIIPDLRC